MKTPKEIVDELNKITIQELYLDGLENFWVTNAILGVIIMAFSIVFLHQLEVVDGTVFGILGMSYSIFCMACYWNTRRHSEFLKLSKELKK